MRSKTLMSLLVCAACAVPAVGAAGDTPTATTSQEAHAAVFHKRLVQKNQKLARRKAYLHRQHVKSSLAEQCQSCPLLEVCGGGYLPHRFSTEGGYRNPSVYCADLEYLIRHVQGSLREHGWSLSASAAPTS